MISPDEATAIALISALPPTILALSTLVVGIRNSRKVEVVHKTLNSRLDELLELTRREAHAAGMKQQLDSPDTK